MEEKKEKNEVLQALETFAGVLSEPPEIIYQKLKGEGVKSLSDLTELDAKVLKNTYKLRDVDARNVRTEISKISLKRRGCFNLLSKDESKCLYAQLFEVIAACSTADFCFVCDITGSMQEYIKTVKEVLNKLVESIMETVNAVPRFAFVGYKDLKDNPQFFVQDFTNNLDAFRTFLNDVKCNGGDDECEDIRGAMLRAENLSWKSLFKHVIFICDAPPHGKAYNGGCDDNYPDYDQKPSLEDIIKHYARMVHVLFYKCNSTVDGLADLFDKHCNNSVNTYTCSSLEKGGAAPTTFMKVFKESLAKSTRWGKRVLKGVYKKITPEAFTLRCESGCKVVLYSAQRTKTPDFKNKQHSVQFEMEKRPAKKFKISNSSASEGAFKTCFKVQDSEDTGDQYIMKLPKLVAHYMTIEIAKEEVDSYMVATYCAEQFNRTVVGKNHKIVFLECMIGELEEGEVKKEHFNKNKFVFVERFMEGDYAKYNNNSGWVNSDLLVGEDCKLAQAFSHYTYECTIGTYLIVDLQGHNTETTLYLTDPAVHSSFYPDKFGETNCGKCGIGRFFQTHICNTFCEQLELYPPHRILMAATRKEREDFIKAAGELQSKKLEETMKKLSGDTDTVEIFDDLEEGKKLDSATKYYPGSENVLPDEDQDQKQEQGQKKDKDPLPPPEKKPAP